MTGIDFTAVIVASVSLMGAVLATLQARGANKRAGALERRRVDLEHEQNHWARTDAIIERLTEEIERLDKTLHRTREALESGQQENATLKARLAKAEAHINRLRAIVRGLVEELSQRGFPVPEEVAGEIPNL